ncbi:MAG: hypothetical protein GY820_31075, partial [Gammaproteobacteria bacterium]|nr:hypothetical protein [Gammaproteobacteria bacterium]
GQKQDIGKVWLKSRTKAGQRTKQDAFPKSRTALQKAGRLVTLARMEIRDVLISAPFPGETQAAIRTGERAARWLG